MNMATLWAGFPRLLRAGSAVPLVLLLSNCSERDPLAPPVPVPPSGGPAFVPAALRGTAQVELRETAQLREDGTLTVTVRVLCPEGFQRVESGPLAVFQGLASGEGTLGTGAQICTGHWVWQRVRVFLFTEEAFQPGPANASVQIDLEDPVTGEGLTASDSEVLTIR